MRRSRKASWHPCESQSQYLDSAFSTNEEKGQTVYVFIQSFLCLALEDGGYNCDKTRQWSVISQVNNLQSAFEIMNTRLLFLVSFLLQIRLGGQNLNSQKLVLTSGHIMKTTNDFYALRNHPCFQRKEYCPRLIRPKSLPKFLSWPKTRSRSLLTLGRSQKYLFRVSKLIHPQTL